MSESAAATPATTIKVFGGVSVHGPEGPVSIGGPRQRRLLGLFALRSGSTVTVDWLAEQLWSDDDRPDKPTPAVRTYVSRLRQALPEEARAWIETDPAGYRFAAPDEAVEHRRFDRLRERAAAARRNGDPGAAEAALTQALDLWRGDPFVELEDVDAARPEIERLQVDRLEVFEERWECALALGRHTQITGELAVFTGEHQLRDRATRQYALALHRSGRTPEALQIIAEHRRAVADRSGLDPSEAMVELERALLDGDPALDLEQVGRPLRGYRLLEEIGSGAFSIVWRGVQPSVDREVAIKQIRSELTSRPDFIRAFEAEAQLIARVEHPHIVPLIDYWRDPDSAYLVMRWLRGGTVERSLDDGRWDVGRTLRMARQIGEALAEAHRRGVVHRDVKTANILLDEQGNTFLGDFGIALDAVEASATAAALSHGSPAYAAPEQLRKERLGPQADIFSLGVVVFECLVGDLPFPETTSVGDMVRRQLEDPYPAIDSLRPEVPKHIAAAVARATAKDPAARFGSVLDFIDALEAVEPATSGRGGGRATLVGRDLENPYKGLQTFVESDAADFFGRERLVDELIEQLARDGVGSRCLTVVGPSGSGKSSVVRAGLVPALRRGALEGADQWFVTTMVPSAHPYEALEAALLRVAVNPPTTLLDQLSDGPRGILRSVRRCLASDDDRVLVVIDQLEELFTAAPPEKADGFLQALAVAVEDPATPLRVVATLRADYYDRPLAHPHFARVLKAGSIDVTPLAPDELEAAIMGPAERHGLEFEPGLVAQVAADALGQPGPLPLLQHAMAELFERRDGSVMTSQAYHELGGLTGALAARAEALYVETNEADQFTIRRIFGRLTNPGEHSADLRRRVRLAELAHDSEAQSIIQRFGDARLLTLDRDGATREPTVEVAHEALFREWPRLAGWLREDAELLRSVDAVTAAAETWHAAGREPSDLYRGGRLEAALDLAIQAPDRLRTVDREFVEASRLAAEAARADERAQLRRLRRLVAGVGVALVVALIAGAVALVQQRRANDQARRAEEQTELAIANASEAEAQAALADESAAEAREQAGAALTATRAAELASLASESAAQALVDPELSLLLALELHRREPTAESELVVLNALGSSPLPNRVSSLPPPMDVEGDQCLSTPRPETGLEYTTTGANLITRDLRTGEVTVRGAEPAAPCVFWSGDEVADWRWAASHDGTTWWSGPWDEPWDSTIELETAWFPLEPLFDASTRRVVVGRPTLSELAELALLDLESGELIGDPIQRGQYSLTRAVDESMGLVALSFGDPSRVDDAGSIVVLDADTFEIQFELVTNRPATAMAFDAATNELVANLSPRSLATIDLTTGELLHRIDAPGGARVLTIGVESSGDVMIVTEAGIEWFDRRIGPSRSPEALGGLNYAVILDDGTIFGYDPSARIVGVIDVEGTALVQRSIPIDSFSVASYRSGYVAMKSFNPSDSVELIDLRSGERTRMELRDRAGEPFVAVAASPESDGVWAVDVNNVFGRWIGNEQVARFEVPGAPVRSRARHDRVAHLSHLGDGTFEASLLSYAEESAGVLFRVEADEDAAVHPSLRGGMHVVSGDGTLRTFDERGVLLSTFSTAATVPQAINVDASTGMVAVASAAGADRRGGAVLIDPGTGESGVLPGGAGIEHLGFARGGELLVVTTTDGLTRLWDLSQDRSGGLVWRTTGDITGISSWYDEQSESLWLGTDDRLVEIPLDPAAWLARACELAGRDLTQDEWDRFVPGDEPLQSPC